MAETFYTSYYLTSLGASAKKVQYLLKQNIEEYVERQKLLAAIETIGGNVAFTKATPYTQYRREDRVGWCEKCGDRFPYHCGLEQKSLYPLWYDNAW